MRYAQYLHTLDSHSAFIYVQELYLTVINAEIDLYLILDKCMGRSITLPSYIHTIYGKEGSLLSLKSPLSLVSLNEQMDRRTDGTRFYMNRYNIKLSPGYLAPGSLGQPILRHVTIRGAIKRLHCPQRGRGLKPCSARIFYP